MKKLTLVIMSFVAVMLVSCGGKTGKGGDQDSDSIALNDSTKPFEQQQIEKSIKMHLDSIAAQISTKKYTPLYQAIKDGNITLTDDEKKVQPDYLLDAAAANECQTMIQKYAAFAILTTDKAVAGLYGMDVAGYEASIQKLAADINDKALEKLNEKAPFAQIEQEIYKMEEEQGRINFFWVATCATCVEQLYIASQNADKFLQGYDDEAIANITFRIGIILDAIDRLSVYDAEIQGLAEAVQPLKKINATSVAELKKELAEVKEDLAKAREELVK